MSNPLNKALGISDTDQNEDNGQTNLPVTVIGQDRVTFTDTEQLQVDADYARDGLYDALAKSQHLVDELARYTQQTQTPKSYEVLNAAIKTMAEISMSLVEVNQRKLKVAKDIQSVNATKSANGEGDSNQTNITNNNLFVGSTAEFQEFLENLRR